MVVVSKADRSIKVSNLPENISNDVLSFMFPESIRVERKPFSTIATVEFGSLRDVENYIRKDKTLMIEDKFLGIEGCSAKNEGRSNDDPLKYRQLYITNLPRSTTTEYLDVLFPFAKSIKRLDGCSALAEYRTAKDAETELQKSKTLRIDHHQLTVRLAKDCHRFGGVSGGYYSSQDRYEKGHSSSSLSSSTVHSSFLKSDQSEKKKSLKDNSDILFSGKEILSDLYGLPVEFGRNRQRKGNQDFCFKKQSEQTHQEEVSSNKPTATTSSYSSQSSGTNVRRTKTGESHSKTESDNHSIKDSKSKLERHRSSPLEPNKSKKSPVKIPNKDKFSTSCSTNEAFDVSNKSKNPEASNSSDYSNRSTSNADKKCHNQCDYGFDKSKQSQLEYGIHHSNNRRCERPNQRSKEPFRNREDKKSEENRNGVDRERLSERDRPELSRKGFPENDTWRRDNAFTDKGRLTGRSSDRFHSRIDEHGKQSVRNFCNDKYRWSADRSDKNSSGRGPYTDRAESNSKSNPDRIQYDYKEQEFNKWISHNFETSDMVNLKNSANSNKKTFDEISVKESRRPGWGTVEDKQIFASRFHPNLKWTKGEQKIDQSGQSKMLGTDHRTYSNDPAMDQNRSNGRPNITQDGDDRYRDQFGDRLNMDDKFNKNLHMGKDKSSQSTAVIENKLDGGLDMDYRKLDHGSNVDNSYRNPQTFPRVSNMDQGGFNRSSNIDQKGLDRGSNMDDGRFDRGSDRDQGRFDRSNMDWGRFDRGSSMDRRRFDRGSSMDRGRFDRGSNMDRRRLDNISNADQGRFQRDSNFHQKIFYGGPKMNQERFNRGLVINHERFNLDSKTYQGKFKTGSNIHQRKSERSPNMNLGGFDCELNMNPRRLNRESNGDQGRSDQDPNIDRGEFNRGSVMDHGRFDRGSNMNSRKYEDMRHLDPRISENNWNIDVETCINNRFARDSNVEQKKFNKDSDQNDDKFNRKFRLDQDRFDCLSKMNPNRLNKDSNVDGDSNMDQGRFDRSPNMDQGVFHIDPNLDRGRFNNSSKMFYGKFDKGPNMDHGRFHSDVKMDRNRFQNRPTVDQNLFGSQSKLDQGPDQDQNRFGRGADINQNRVFESPNTEQNRFCNKGQNRFHTVQNRDHNKFNDDCINMSQNRFDTGPNMDQNRFGRAPNLDQSGFSKDQYISKNRFDYVDQNRFGNNSKSQLNKDWESDQRFGRNNSEREIGFKDEPKFNPPQCWSGLSMDSVQNRKGGHVDDLGHPSKRPFSHADDWQNSNIVYRDLQYESHEGASQDFSTNKRPRKDW